MAGLPASIQRARAEQRELGHSFDSAYDQLKPAEQAFVLSYVLKDHPQQAILAAYPGLQKNVINVRALDMMRRPLVQAAIAEKHKERMARFELSAENIIRETALVAFARMGDFVKRDADGTLSLDLSSIPEEELSERLAAVSEVTFEETQDAEGKTVRKTKFKLHSKLDGLDKLIKIAGLYAPEKIDARVLNGSIAEGGTISENMSVSDARKVWEGLLDD